MLLRSAMVLKIALSRFIFRDILGSSHCNSELVRPRHGASIFVYLRNTFVVFIFPLFFACMKIY